MLKRQTPTPLSGCRRRERGVRRARRAVAAHGRCALSVAKYRLTLLVGVGRWQTVNDSLTGTSYTAWGLKCGKRYHYRMSAYGDGATYAARWGPESDAWHVVRC